MQIKKIIDFNKNFTLECPMNFNDFQTAFIKKYRNNKKSDYKGEIEKHHFSLRVNRGWDRVTGFTVLKGEFLTENKKQVIYGKIKLSDSVTIMHILGIITLPIMITYHIITTGLDIDFIASMFALLLGFIIVVKLQVYRDKTNYTQELKGLFKEYNEKKVR